MAQDILANFRIPHHTPMDYWLDGVAVLQILWIVLGICLAWRTRLFTVLLVSFVLACSSVCSRHRHRAIW